MTENLDASDSLGPAGPARGTRGSFLRRFAYPLLVIAAIAAVIWYLEYRDGGGSYSPTGEEYGPVELPASLVPSGLSVGAQEGDLAPDFLLERLDGGELRLSDLRGQPVVVNFWATWCVPCRKEMPQLVRAYDRYKDEGLVIVGVNLQEGKDTARPFAEDFGMDFPIGIDVDGEVGDTYRLLGLPTTFFIDREGVIRSVFTGPFVEKDRGTEVRGAIEESELEQRIGAILTPAPEATQSGDR